MNSIPGDSSSFSLPESGIGRIARRLCIVARNHPLLFGYLSTLFRDLPPGAERIEIVIDRRHAQAQKTAGVDRRRASPTIEDELRRRGFAFVTQPGEAFSPRDAARIEHTVELLAGMEDRSWPFRRRRRRPLWKRWQRLWTRRPWKPLAGLGALALFSTLLATEFTMNDFRDPDISAAIASRPPVKLPVPEPAVPNLRAPEARPPADRLPPDRLTIDTAAPVTPPAVAAAAAPAPDPAPAPAVPAPSTSAVPAASQPQPAATTFFAPLAPPVNPPAPTPAATSPQGTGAQRVTSERDGGAKPAAKPAPRVEKARPVATVAAVTEPAAPAPAAAPATPDLRLELSRRPTSATGGGFVYTVRVTDREGQPRSDAEVWLAAGRRSSGALFETRMLPAELAGTYRSGVVHPSTLPPDMMVKAQIGSRRAEAPVER